jgi:organic hydroperoxide reductase OsmC/OhrA
VSKFKPKKFIYNNSVSWQGEKLGIVSAIDKPIFKVATPPEFKGHPGIWSPEDLFVASVNSCIMTTFLYFAEKQEIGLVHYNSEAEGQVEMVENKLIFSEIRVKPYVIVTLETQIEKVKEILSLSEKYCLISNSIKCKIIIISNIKVKEA